MTFSLLYNRAPTPRLPVSVANLRTEMASDVHFKFCFKCAEEVVVGDALIFCENCVLKIDPKDPSALSTRVDEMKFCYICGKQLYRGKKYLICRDGCTLCIPLQPETESGTRDDIETNKGNQYEDKPEILYSTPIVISEPVPQRVAQYPLTGKEKYLHRLPCPLIIW